VVFSLRISIANNAAKKGLTLKRAELRVVPIILRAANIIEEPIPNPNIPPTPNKINDRIEGVVVFLLEEGIIWVSIKKLPTAVIRIAFADRGVKCFILSPNPKIVTPHVAAARSASAAVVPYRVIVNSGCVESVWDISVTFGFVLLTNITPVTIMSDARSVKGFNCSVPKIIASSATTSG